MSRIAIATIAGLVGMTVYIVAIMLMGDFIHSLHWAIQAIFFAVAGLVWVFPAKALMYWSVRK